LFVIDTSSIFQQRVERDALNLLYGNNSGSIVVTLSISLALVFGFPDNPDQPLKVYWILLICALLLWRYRDMYYWQKNLKGTEYNARKPMQQFVINRYFTAITLGIYPIIFLDKMDVIELACTITIMSAMAGGAATILAANKWLALSYALILILPVSILCLFAPESYQNILGLLGSIFAVVMLYSAKRSHEFTAESILIKNKHADLLDEMVLKNNKISEINSNLETKVKQRTEQILELSNIDPLTKLFNRTSFSESLKSLITSSKAENKKLAVLFVDLDGFKSINDAHGHAVGDEILIETAKRLKSHIKDKKCMCRWGGDEFLIILQDNLVDQAYQLAKQLIHVLSQPINVHPHILEVGATIGISIYPDHSVDEAQLIALADTAMYAQKQIAKSNACLFTEEIKASLNKELMLKDGLIQALKNEQLFVVFQPVINSNSGKVSFCEALLRWKYGSNLISPNEFIPVTEQHGLIHSIGSWVLHESCRLAANWTFDSSVNVSINVSIAQFMRGDLLDVVKSALHSSGLPAKNLHLEITESIFSEDIDYVLEQTKALQKLNIKVSIDDFGTGFSSLALLQSISADIVKIDRRFIASMDKGGEAIIQATQYIANELGYSVVAEGIETKEQADILSEMGIDSLQGFYFSKPMKVEQLPAWHKTFTNNVLQSPVS